MRRAVVLLLVSLAGCSAASSPDHGAGGGGGASASASSATGTGGGTSCDVNSIDLIVTQSDGVPSRVHVPVTYNGEAALFLLDTGSSGTFLRLGKADPDFVPDAGEVRIGCETRMLPGRGGLAPAPDELGLPVVGTLGADFMIGGATLLDTRDGKLVRRLPDDVPAETADWTPLDYDDVQGLLIAPVSLDGSPVRLMLDTGSPHILWLGEQGKPGDTEVTTQDAQGTEIVLYYGDVQLEMAARAKVTVPVLRAPSFPYFEQTVEKLGGNIHGLLGLSAFQGRALLFDGAAKRVRLGPVPHP